jgi:hypothetical protein
MKDSSAPQDCSTTSSNDVGFIAQEISTIFPDTITLTSNAYDTMIGSGTVTIGNTTGYTIGTGVSYTGSVGGAGGGGTFTINADSINTHTFSWKNEEFVDCMPNINRIEAMCKEYPGLAIAFEKFKTTYNIVKDDYDNPKDKK